MNVAVVDIGKPGVNFGWALVGNARAEGRDIDVCVERLAAALRIGPLALGLRGAHVHPDPYRPEAADFCSQWRVWPFSASAGATSLVTGMVVVSNILAALRPLVPEAAATRDWRLPAVSPGRLMLFEAFVTGQRKTADTRQVEDARVAIAAFQRGMREPASFQSSVEEPICLSLLGAVMLRTGWGTDPAILSIPASSFERMRQSITPSRRRV